MIDGLFFVAIVFLFYTFIVYPLVIAVTASRHAEVSPTLGELPTVSVIVAVHNEAAAITGKMENVLQIQYPPDRLEIIVASDHSTDGTDEIIGAYATRGIKLVTLATRGGKVAAQNLGVQYATGDILVFSDASTLLKADIVQKLVPFFADPLIGCVSCEDRSLSAPGRVEDEGLYLRYEMFIRRAESRLGLLMAASGCCFAIRRTLWMTFDVSLSEDFMLPLLLRERGYKTVSAPDAIAYIPNLVSPYEEFRRRVRTATHGLMSLFEMRHLLNPCRAGGFAWTLISHKLCRFVVPFVLVATLLTNVALVGTSWFYTGTLGIQLLFYGAAFVGWMWGSKAPRAVSLPLYLVRVQCAISKAWLCAILDRRCAIWSPSRRSYPLSPFEVD